MNPIRDKQYLYFETQYIDLVTVDKRAFYIFIQELAYEVEGPISEDGMETWQTLDEFQQKHQAYLTMSFEEANEKSLQEADILECVDEPWDNEVDYGQ